MMILKNYLMKRGINAWKKEIDFLGTGDGMVEHIWRESGTDKWRFSV